MTEPSRTPTLILGAGLTGLSCAYHLGDGGRYRLIERESQVGGLARTRTRPGGFLCDGTGHWLHLRTEPMKQLVDTVLGDNLESRERRARVYSKGVYTLYPFQANTYGLPKEVIAECLNGLIAARFEEQHPEPKNYLEWIRATFGEGICKHFMVPYNRKIYGVPLESLAADFAAKYIPQPDLRSVIDGALGLSREQLGYNARFVYPKRGGIGALPEGLHRHLDRPAELGRKPRAIDVRTRTVSFEDGERITCDQLVSTVPLDHLVDLCVAGDPSSVPAAVIEARGRLRANSVLYFDVAIKGAPSEHQDYHWIYLPENEFSFYRVGSYSAVERSLAPEGFRSYYVEFGHYGDVDPSRFEQSLMDGLRRLGILEREEDLVFAIPNVLAPAYVLADDHYASSRATVLDWCASVGIDCVGRYGRWQYNAMEDALREGKEAADRAPHGGRA
jgi:protoporphyrinogen oxidase